MARELARVGRVAAKLLFAALFLTSGVMHFTRTDLFARIIPPSFPEPRWLVWFSGVCEIALGVMLLIPATSRLAAWGLIALLIAVFPANIYLYRHQDLIPTALPPLVHLLRLPFQGVLILWAYAYTRDRRSAPDLDPDRRPT
ncbi:DoxX family protein [Tundrisphaera sp. TA3]|uniref:DoxX family protein n=1 Tax=Tundrisphaera sp. TA3 TaxID=3435775 RepID=UPI003EBA31C9